LKSLKSELFILVNSFRELIPREFECPVGGTGTRSV
jgi:hypothetical protein